MRTYTLGDSLGGLKYQAKRDRPHTLADRATEYLARCDSALRVAQLVGDSAWKIRELFELCSDARAMANDWRALLSGSRY